jgi:hypothetical protein
MASLVRVAALVYRVLFYRALARVFMTRVTALLVHVAKFKKI